MDGARVAAATVIEGVCEREGTVQGDPVTPMLGVIGGFACTRTGNLVPGVARATLIAFVVRQVLLHLLSERYGYRGFKSSVTGFAASGMA